MKTYKEYLNLDEETLVRTGDVVKEIDIQGFEPIGILFDLPANQKELYYDCKNPRQKYYSSQI